MGARLTILLLGIVFLFSHPARAQTTVPVDLELAFVVDASGSIDEDEMALQRQGYADALAHPRILRAIRGGLLRSIAVAYIEFAGDGCTRMGVGWRTVSDAASAAEFGRAILSLERSYCFGGNAVSDALAFAADSIRTNRFEGTRRVIDISGDGPNTMGEPVELVRDAIVGARITINALAIHRETMPDLPEYFKRSVIGGPGAFMIKANNRRAFAEAILKKLIREIASEGSNNGPVYATRVSGETLRRDRK